MTALPYRGWWVLLAGYACTMLAIGSTTYTFGLFVAPMSETFGLSRADANTGFICCWAWRRGRRWPDDCSTGIRRDW